MNNLTDHQLLADYAAQRSEAAFAELVRRHVDLVYSVAVRLVCEAHLAQDVTQGVFVALAENARQLADRTALEGWLHGTTRNLAANAVRSDVRRRAREQEAAVMNELLSADPDPSWEHIAPHLDEALGELDEPDREALLLRYFKNHDLRTVGTTLGISDDAAQKRVSRALERLRERFAKRGITVGATGLVVVLSANAVHAAPVGLAATISTVAALSGTTLATGATAAATKAVAMTTLQKAAITATVAVLTGVGIYEARQALQSRAQNQTPQHRQAALAAASAGQTAAAEPSATGTGGLPPVVPISLAPVFVPPENDQWSSGKEFLAMPRGVQQFGGIEFWLEGVVELQSTRTQEDKQSFREKIAVPLALTNAAGAQIQIVQRGSNVASVHLLGATRYAGEADSPVADLVWRYTDGSSRRSPVLFRNHVRNWVRDPYEMPAVLPYAFSKVVWRAEHPTGPGRALRLYRFSYANPAPQKVVRQLELASTMNSPSLFVVGLTLDPLKLGERPDDSPNLEPTDAAAPSVIELTVQDSQGLAVPGAKVRVFCQQVNGKPPQRITNEVKTDRNGFYRIIYPPTADLEQLEITASQDDYSSRKMVWMPSAGDVIPPSYTLKLGGGVTIGGTVVDSLDQPLAGAKISLHRFWKGGEEMNKKGEQADFASRSVTTDAQGFWQARGLPATLLDHIGFNVEHADYPSTNFTAGSNPSIEQQLCALTFKVVLQAGLEVRGRVTDEAGVAIVGATVWAGSRYARERQEQKTDAAGRFSFRKITEGDVQFSVVAKGRKPAVKPVKVKLGMGEISFKLTRGQVIRGLVRNQAGEPLSDARIALESYFGGVAETYEFNATTGVDGRFEWDGAPDEPQQFYFWKTSYEQKRQQRLKVDEENIVTLRKSRQVKGWVLDAETEKPITKFRIEVGSGLDTATFYADHPGMKAFANENGMFTTELDEEIQSSIKAEAEDYAGKVEPLPPAQDGMVQVTLRLKPSAALRALAVTPGGETVPGATVAFASGKPGNLGVGLKNGRLIDYGPPSKTVVSDASGQFTLPSPPETGLVVGAAEIGFGTATIQQVRESGRLVLQPFGVIEGMFKIGGQPGAGQEFVFSLGNLGIMADFDSYKTATDAEGRFKLERIPPGPGQIVRLVRTSIRSWAHSHATDVLVEPGKTTQVTLGDSGAVLQAHVRVETPPAESVALTISGRLTTQMPTPPSFTSPAEAQAFFNSPEWKERTEQTKHFAVNVNADGSFALDSIPPGTYTLTLTAANPGTQPWEQQPVAESKTTVTIPEHPNPLTPISLGEIILKPPPKP